MRLTDLVFRQGHLSERAIVDAVTTGTRPLHLDRCDICAERAVELARFLDNVKTDAVELSDSVFTTERIAAGQHQILRRLEQLDHPARVISFPAASRLESRGGGRRVGISWVGVAAAAGLVLGLVGGQVTARLSQHPTPATTTTTAEAAAIAMFNEQQLGAPGNPAVFAENYEEDIPSPLRAMNDLTPHMTQTMATIRK